PCCCAPVVPAVEALTFAGTDARAVAMLPRSAFTFCPFRRAKNAASRRKITASPLKLPGVTVKSADSRCAISVPFNNDCREKAITISDYKVGLLHVGTESVSMPIAFLPFSIDRHSMGQQHRVRMKRKRRVAYLRRKKASQRAAAARPGPAKQQAQKESVPAE